LKLDFFGTAFLYGTEVILMRKVIRGYKVKIYPNDVQIHSIEQTLGCVRHIWNYSLMERFSVLELFGDYPELFQSHKYNLQKDWKRDFEFYKEADSQALNTEQQIVNQTFKNWRKGVCRKPRYKSKKRDRASYTTHTTNNNIRIEDDKIKLPKVGWVQLKKKRKELPEGAIIKAATVSKNPSGKYYVSLRLEFEQEVEQRKSNVKVAIGLDFSTTHFYIDSSGKKANFPLHIEQTLAKIKRYQRKMSKQKRGSKGRERTRLRIAKLYEKKNNQLKDFHHKTANKLITYYDIIGVETLSLQDMNDKKYYQQQIQKMGYRRFLDILSYKCEDKGVIFNNVHKYYPSSKTCSFCGKIKKTFPLSQTVYECDCGNVMNRDMNAAMNLATKSIEQYLINDIEDRTASIAW
jgi:putative transposase